MTRTTKSLYEIHVDTLKFTQHQGQKYVHVASTCARSISNHHPYIQLHVRSICQLIPNYRPCTLSTIDIHPPISIHSILLQRNSEQSSDHSHEANLKLARSASRLRRATRRSAGRTTRCARGLGHSSLVRAGRVTRWHNDETAACGGSCVGAGCGGGGCSSHGAGGLGKVGGWNDRVS